MDIVVTMQLIWCRFMLLFPPPCLRSIAWEIKADLFLPLLTYTKTVLRS